jgi:uncharacterized membrane protein YoaT (DUF817 family)
MMKGLGKIVAKFEWFTMEKKIFMFHVLGSKKEMFEILMKPNTLITF